MLGLFGKKIGMTQIFGDQGSLIPVTVIEANPCPVVQVKNLTNDGYSAIKVAFQAIPETRINRPKSGVFKKAGIGYYKYLQEFRADDVSGFTVGDLLKVEMFEVGEKVNVSGQSKGKGFQGTVKRHGFKGGPKTHGQSDRHRAPGSIGQSSTPSRVFKGTRMSGHMGDVQVSIKGLRVVRIDEESNVMLLQGAVPGPKGGTIVIRKTH